MAEVQLPAAFQAQLDKLPPDAQLAFHDQYNRRARSLGTAYLIGFFGWHYGYLKEWGKQILFWISGGGLLVWWVVDLFRMKKMCEDYNSVIATDCLLQVKAITAD